MLYEKKRDREISFGMSDIPMIHEKKRTSIKNLWPKDLNVSRNKVFDNALTV